ncbi:MAG: large conductance mechanosensitive channel protein MscL [Clostridia bacterium]|nr:large conductance mechanosensitive channel protein MscL [Clostridia bacterium]
MSDKKTSQILQEFKAFVMRGNVLDLAVGVIVGGAFQKIVTSAVNDLIMPFIGLVTGGVNFNEQFVVLKGQELIDAAILAGTPIATAADATAAGATVFAYGTFITAVIDFLIMAVIVFFLVKGINKLTSLGKKPVVEEPAAPTTKICAYCRSEIAIEATRCPHCTSEVE